jgi:hypothetical protein
MSNKMIIETDKEGEQEFENEIKIPFLSEMKKNR